MTVLYRALGSDTEMTRYQKALKEIELLKQQNAKLRGLAQMVLDAYTGNPASITASVLVDTANEVLKEE